MLNAAGLKLYMVCSIVVKVPAFVFFVVIM